MCDCCNFCRVWRKIYARLTGCAKCCIRCGVFTLVFTIIMILIGAILLAVAIHALHEDKESTKTVLIVGSLIVVIAGCCFLAALIGLCTLACRIKGQVDRRDNQVMVQHSPVKQPPPGSYPVQQMEEGGQPSAPPTEELKPVTVVDSSNPFAVNDVDGGSIKYIDSTPN